jgi:hypothetical protein
MAGLPKISSIDWVADRVVVRDRATQAPATQNPRAGGRAYQRVACEAGAVVEAEAWDNGAAALTINGQIAQLTRAEACTLAWALVKMIEATPSRSRRE